MLEHVPFMYEALGSVASVTKINKCKIDFKNFPGVRSDGGTPTI